MTGQIATGTALVLLTWGVAALLVTGVGLPIALLSDRAAPALSAVRAALWWGVAASVIVIPAIGLLMPLRSAQAAAAYLTIFVLMATCGLLLLRTRWRRAPANHGRTTRSTWAVLVSLCVVTIYQAFKALGPVTNYDTGLYHLGAIKYAGDYATIPGLANLFFPFGYNNTQFPLAAIMGNGPWDGVGYRLLNGLFLVLVFTDLALRLWQRRFTWGTFTLLVGVGAVAIPLVAIADFWVASPTSDTVILLLTIVSTSYLADFLSSTHQRSLHGSVAVVTVIVMVSMRPTMLFFAAATLLIVVATLVRRGGLSGINATAWGLLGATAVAVACTQALRDHHLSGWLLYPLSIANFDVPWLALDPTVPRDATLAAARDPSAPDQYEVAHSWTWIPIWFGRLWQQWETYFLLVGLLTALVVGLLARRAIGFPRHPWRIAGCMLPSGVAVVAWFSVSPPSFRFIWGSLFCLAFVPLGAALAQLHRERTRLPSPFRLSTPLTLVSVSLVLVSVTGYSALFRNQADSITESRSWTVGQLTLPYAITPIPRPPVKQETMLSGLVLTTPLEGDQCWDNYPLCSFSMGNNIDLIGPTIQEGFIRR